MTAVDDFAESTAQQRAREKAEHAEWQQLTAVYFAHQERMAPGCFHCFCGSLYDLRAAVTDLERETASAGVADVSAHRVSDPIARAADAAHAAQLRVGEEVAREAQQAVSPAASLRPLDTAHDLERSRDADDAH